MHNKYITRSAKFRALIVVALFIAVGAASYFINVTVNRYKAQHIQYAKITTMQLDQIRKSVLITKALGKESLIAASSDFTEIMTILIKENIMNSIPIGVNGEKFAFLPNAFGNNLAFAAINFSTKGVCEEIDNKADLKEEKTLLAAYYSLDKSRQNLPFCFKGMDSKHGKIFTVAIKI